jgi:hypothetical protein
MIAGTSDEVVGSAVTVTIATQVVATVVQIGGVWEATPSPLTDGTYTVTASVTDAAGNTGVALQVLTVDTTAPSITIDGAASVATNDDTPAIGGTSSAIGSLITVHVGGQILTTTVQLNGVWSAVAGLLANSTFAVTATVEDGGGNQAGASQWLTVDTVLPLVNIAGGAAVVSADNTPTLRGTADEPKDTIVNVSIDGGSSHALVQSDGTWNLTPAALTNGAHAIVASVTDLAGNSGVAAQSLTVRPLISPAPPASVLDFTPVGPKRIFDTRPGQSPDALVSVPKAKVGGDSVLRVQVTNLAGFVPSAGVGAVSLTVTVTDPVAAGYLTVYACGQRELVSSLNFVAGQTVANTVIAPLSANGSVCVFSSAATDVLADINGWFAAGHGFTPIGPVRAFDTRAGQSPQALRSVPKAQLDSEHVIAIRLVDLVGYVPADGVGSVSMNVTVTNPTGAGFVTVDSCGVRQFVSNVNFVSGETVATAVVSNVSAGGMVCFYSSVPTDLVVDLNGWFSDQSGYTSVSPMRLLDTRFGQSPNALRLVYKSKVSGSYELQVKVTDLEGVVPSGGVGAVVLNVIATNPEGSGFVTVYPCGARGEVSNLNFVDAETVSNLVITPVSPDGSICLFSPVPVDLVVDVSGWFADS